MDLQNGTNVRHRKDRAFGLGQIVFSQPTAGVRAFYVNWPASPGGPKVHTFEELEPVLPIVDRLSPGRVGDENFMPFTLRVMARWFEVRHSLTGELSNQPFQMLPHQVIVTNRVINSTPGNRRWLIADDVGLGKTIEAGMIMEVLRKHKLGAFRCLIVTPAGLMTQWKEEMELRFGRRFRIFKGAYVNDLEESPLLVASIDTLKAKKYQDALRQVTPWDLVIFDEAHHLASETNVQRYVLPKHLREHSLARNLLFLTATPHSGNREHFWNMLKLLREDLFPGRDEVARGDGRLNQVMIRNRKSDVTDATGKRIFQGVEPAKIMCCTPTKEEVHFYEELLRYVRTGYGVADRLKKENNTTANAVGFLMSTFKKLASSSRAAIRSALQNRLRVLEEDIGEAPVQALAVDARYEGEKDELDTATIAIEFAAAKKGKKKLRSPIQDEATKVRGLLELLDGLKTGDSKLEYFVRELKQMRSDLKVLIFTEYRGTQEALLAALAEAFGEEPVTYIHGSMALEERRARVEAFNEKAPNPRFLVSTEAGGEGLNMQKACHIIMNYDLPWNPMRLQQRIGRVYRYGQREKVKIYNFRLESDSEAFADGRIEEYLRKKIREITERLAEVQDGNPEDIEGDVLGQVALNMSINELYEQALKPGGEDAVRDKIDANGEQIRQVLEGNMLGLFKGLKRFDITDYEKTCARVNHSQLQFFVNQYLGRHNCPVERDDGLLSFEVPEVLREVSARIPKEDAHEARDVLKDRKVHRATVDKGTAQKVRDCRLLRFGDVVFDSMVKHVQDSDFSDGVATLEVSPGVLGWTSGDIGTCAVFDMKVIRQEGSSGARVLREELVAYTVRSGQAPVQAEHLLESMHEVNSGPVTFDVGEVRRAYGECRAAAEAHMKGMLNDVVREHGTSEAIVPQYDDFALAFVRAST